MRIFITFILLFLSFNLYCENEIVISTGSTTMISLEMKKTDLIKRIKYKLIKLFNPQRTKLVTAVIAVRGNSYDSKNNLYWKTSNSEKLNEKIENEKKIINEILEMISSGDIEEAKKELQDFIKNNPHAYLIDDAQKLLEQDIFKQ